MDAMTRQLLVQKYKAGIQEVTGALAGATLAELDARPAPGKWSARQIVHHLGDSEMAAAFRLRLLLAADNPAIMGYDQDQFAARLHYDRPIEASLQAFTAARLSTGELLDRMTEADWSREGTHSEIGRYTMGRWLELYSEHAHKHAEQVRRARKGSYR